MRYDLFQKMESQTRLVSASGCLQSWRGRGDLRPFTNSAKVFPPLEQKNALMKESTHDRHSPGNSVANP
jgi:hypothetical protein